MAGLIAADGFDAGIFLGLKAAAPDVSISEAARIANVHFDLDGEVTRLAGELDCNFRVRGRNRDCVLKLTDAAQRLGILQAEAATLLYIAARNPGLPVPRVVPAWTGETALPLLLADGRMIWARMLSFLPGKPLETLAVPHAVLRPVGRLVGELDRTLVGFDHPAARDGRLIWDIREAPAARALVRHVHRHEDRALVAAALEEFIANALPALDRLRSQVIHNDAHGSNLLVDSELPGTLTGLVDFGDLRFGPVLFDVVVPMADIAISGLQPYESATEILAGYRDTFPLEESEIAVLYDCIIARQAITLGVLGWRQGHDPAGTAILSEFETNARDGLDTLMSLGREEATRRFSRAAGLGSPLVRGTPLTPSRPLPLADAGYAMVVPAIRPPLAAEPVPAATAARPNYCEIARPVGFPDRFAAQPPAQLPAALPFEVGKPELIRSRRARLLGGGLELSYDEPVHVVRGDDVFLIADDGRRYLDCYNNVPQVGHSHPAVADAVARQWHILNTNTRYLSEPILDYAERLIALMPKSAGLDRCLFVNCGSEANDIAWRMAKLATGARGGITMDNAYHGGTDAVAALSPYDQQRFQLAPHIRTLEAPDCYRGRFAGELADAGRLYATDAERATRSLADAGHGTAAFIVDTGFISSGMLDAPANYLTTVAETIRRAGGLVIADEVQFGFARSGDRFWGFDTHRLVPDFVTIGKPAGNGQPLGVVVTRADILDRFFGTTGYFSTFGGNQVSAVAGLAVLDVIERQQLQENARVVGGYLKEGLRRMQQIHPAIGDVRGQGLKLGVEIVSSRLLKSPDRIAAKRIANAVRARGCLIGTEGPDGNVLKIRPPLTFSTNHADQLLAALDSALAETARG